MRAKGGEERLWLEATLAFGSAYFETPEAVCLCYNVLKTGIVEYRLPTRKSTQLMLKKCDLKTLPLKL